MLVRIPGYHTRSDDLPGYLRFASMHTLIADKQGMRLGFVFISVVTTVISKEWWLLCSVMIASGNRFPGCEKTQYPHRDFL